MALNWFLWLELVTYRVTGWFTILHSLPPLIKNVQEVLNLVIRHDRRVRLYITYYSSQSLNVVISFFTPLKKYIFSCMTFTKIFSFTKKFSSSRRNVQVHKEMFKFMKKCSCSRRNVQVHKEMFKFMKKYSSSRRNVHKAKTCLL